MPAWPDIPFFCAVTGSEQTGPTGAVIRTRMDAGPDKVRRRTTAAPRSFRGRTPFLTRAQLTTFETWFSSSIADGALSFTADDPYGGGEKAWRFVGSYTVQRLGSVYVVSAELERLP